MTLHTLRVKLFKVTSRGAFERRAKVFLLDRANMPYQIELDVSLVKMFALLIFKNLWKHKISINERSINLFFYFFEMNKTP